MRRLTGHDVPAPLVAQAVDAAGIGTWDYDPRTGACRWSPALRRMLAVPDGVRENFDTFVTRLHEGSRDQALAAVAAALDPAVRAPYQVELRMRRWDGADLWVAASGIARFRGRGAAARPVRLLGVARDLTWRHRLLAEKDALMAELHHRVKNNLQAVQVLLQLQALATPAARAGLEALGARVDVMARVHRLLTHGGAHAAVDLAAFLGGLCADVHAAHADAARVRLELDLCPATLDLERAVSAGLVANELVVNAIRHAFPGGRAGTVRVRLAPLPGHTLRLEVADDGVGTPAGGAGGPGSGRGLAEVLARRLGGALDALPGPGTRVRVDFQAGPG